MNTINIQGGATLQKGAILQMENLTYCKPMNFFDMVKLTLKRYEVRTRELNTREYINVLEQRNRASQKKQAGFRF